MPTLVELDGAEESCALCARLGLQFVELNMNLPAFQAHRLASLASLQDRFGAGFTIHADENLNPADFNPLISGAYVETMRRTIRAARELQAPVVNLHLSRGVYFTLPGERVYLFGRYRGEYLERMRAFRAVCEEEISGAPVRVCLENTDGWLDFQREAVELLLESEVFGLTWDVGHSHCARLDDEPFLRTHADRLAHFHIHDAASGGNHLTLGTGEVDLAGRLAMAAERGCRCVVETKTVWALERSVEWLRTNGFL